MKFMYTGSHPMFLSIKSKSMVILPKQVIEAKIPPNSLFVAVEVPKTTKVAPMRTEDKPTSKKRKPRGPLDAHNS